MLGIDLRETENLAVCERTLQTLAQLLQISYLFIAQSQTLFSLYARKSEISTISSAVRVGVKTFWSGFSYTACNIGSKAVFSSGAPVKSSMR